MSETFTSRNEEQQDSSELPDELRGPAEALRTRIGTSQAAAEAIVGGVGEDVHPHYGSTEEVNQEAGIGRDFDFWETGMTRSEAMFYSDKVVTETNSYFGPPIEAPSHIPEAQKDAYVKMAESMMLWAVLIGNGINPNNKEDMTNRVEVSNVQVYGSHHNPGQNSRTATHQSVWVTPRGGHRGPNSISVVHTYDDEGNITGFGIFDTMRARKAASSSLGTPRIRSF